MVWIWVFKSTKIVTQLCMSWYNRDPFCHFFVYVCIVSGHWKRIFRRNVETSVVEFRITFFFSIRHINLFSLLHSECWNIKLTVLILSFNIQQQSKYCMSFSISWPSNIFFFLVCSFSYHEEGWKNFSLSAFSSHSSVLYNTCLCGDSGLP